MSAENASFDGHNFPFPSSNHSNETSSEPSQNDLPTEVEEIKPLTKGKKIAYTAAALGIGGAFFFGGKSFEERKSDQVDSLVTEHALQIDQFSSREHEIFSEFTSPSQQERIDTELSILREDHESIITPLSESIESRQRHEGLGNNLQHVGVVVWGVTAGVLLAAGTVAYEAKKQEPSSPEESLLQDQTS